jgi:hypothetical protein
MKDLQLLPHLLLHLNQLLVLVGAKSGASLLNLVGDIKVLELTHDLLSLLLALRQSLQRFLDRACARGGLAGAAQLNIREQVHGQDCVVHKITVQVRPVRYVLRLLRLRSLILGS